METVDDHILKYSTYFMEKAKKDGKPFHTSDFDDIMKQFLGYLNKANITVVDFSGIPFEVLSITVSLVSRLIFDFCFHYSKLRHEKGDLNASGSWIRRGNVLGLVVDRTPPEGAATTRPLAPSGIVLWSLRQGLRTRFHFWMRKDAADETEATNREEPDDG